MVKECGCMREAHAMRDARRAWLCRDASDDWCATQGALAIPALAAANFFQSALRHQVPAAFEPKYSLISFKVRQKHGAARGRLAVTDVPLGCCNQRFTWGDSRNHTTCMCMFLREPQLPKNRFIGPRCLAGSRNQASEDALEKQHTVGGRIFIVRIEDCCARRADAGRRKGSEGTC